MSSSSDLQNPPPEHIAVIMDGNGRWAKQSKLKRLFGHKEGSKAAKRTIRGCNDLGVKYLTLYVFSSENWKRPEWEVNALMGLLIDQLTIELPELQENNVKLLAMGNLDRLPQKTRDKLESSIQETSNNTGLNLTLAISYGGREEILHACKSIAKRVQDGSLEIAQINEKVFSENLYMPEFPDPQLLIRTGGDMRVSNYMLWQIAYSELYITDTLWPDFTAEELFKAVEKYQGVQRNFGSIQEKNNIGNDKQEEYVE
jgi:undecaprenyl diphosphate synthase